MNDQEAYDYYADPANQVATGPPVRHPKDMPQLSFSCPHLSVGNVASVTCGTCGPLEGAA